MATAEKRHTKKTAGNGKTRSKHWERLEVAASEVREWPEWKKVGFQTSPSASKVARAKK